MQKANYVPINSLAIATADDPAIVTFISEIETSIPLPTQSTLRLLEDSAVGSSFDSLANDINFTDLATDTTDTFHINKNVNFHVRSS